MATRTPPRFVPTLTEVVQSAPESQGLPSSFSQEQLAQRVLQRVDVALDRRLREAIATVIVEQTAALVPLLRQEIEGVVRELVAQAVAEEIQLRQRGGNSGV
jgi:hypothetical protein